MQITYLLTYLLTYAPRMSSHVQQLMHSCKRCILGVLLEINEKPGVVNH